MPSYREKVLYNYWNVRMQNAKVTTHTYLTPKAEKQNADCRKELKSVRMQNAIPTLHTYKSGNSAF